MKKFRAGVFTLLCFFLCGCSITVQGMQPLPTPVSTVATHTARIAPTAPPLATSTPTTPPTVLPTPTKVLPAVPHMGDAIAVFDRYYGTFINVSTTQIKQHQYSDDTGAVPFTIIASYDTMQGNRVFTITVRLDNNRWDPNNQKDYYFPTLFIPNDANMTGHQALMSGMEDQYVSALLAPAFPALYFMDNNGKMVQRGSANIFYRYSSDGKTFIHATISLGTVYGL